MVRLLPAILVVLLVTLPASGEEPPAWREVDGVLHVPGHAIELDWHPAGEIGAAPVERVRIYTRDLERDPGWTLFHEQPAEEKTFRFTAEADGRYGLRIVLLDATGEEEPAPDAGTPPQAEIVFDTVAPQIRLEVPDRVATGEPIRLIWEITDRSGTGAPRIEASRDGRTWTPAAADLDPSARAWDSEPLPVAGERLYRVTVEDHAGNATTAGPVRVTVEGPPPAADTFRVTTGSPTPEGFLPVEIHPVGGSWPETLGVRLWMTPDAGGSWYPAPGPHFIADARRRAIPIPGNGTYGLLPLPAAKAPPAPGTEPLVTIEIRNLPQSSPLPRDLPVPAGELPEAEAARRRASLLLARGRRAEAASALRESVDRWPGYLDAWNDLAILLYGDGQYEESTRIFDGVLAIAPDRTDIRFNLGLTLVGGGRKPEAAEAFERVLASSPEHEGALYYLARLLAERGQTSRAIELIESLLRNDDGRYIRQAGRLLVELRRGTRPDGR